MKILALTLLFALVLISVSCGGGGDSNEASTGSETDVSSDENRFDPSAGTEKEVAATTGTSAPVGDMGEQRAWFPAVVLDDGRVLVAGGKSPKWAAGAADTAEVYNPNSNVWEWTEAMTDARFQNAMAKLPDGRVIVAGGRSIENRAIDTAEIWDPETGLWTPTLPMNQAHETMPMVSLGDGRVMVIGGADDTYAPVTTVEVYDPATNGWVEIDPMSEKRIWHTATLLSDGRILVTGGGKPDGPWIKTAEIFDPETELWSSAGEMSVSRAQHTATLLKDGRVLVVGGRGKRMTAEIYDPSNNTWGSKSDLNIPRAEHIAELLPDGRVIVAGGTGSRDNLEIYDPATTIWAIVGDMLMGRYRFNSALLNDGRILIIGGQALDGILAATEAFTLDIGEEIEATILSIDESAAAEATPIPTATPMPTPTPDVLTTVDLEFKPTVDHDGSSNFHVATEIPVRMGLTQKMNSPTGINGIIVQFTELIEDNRATGGVATVRLELFTPAGPLGGAEMSLESGQTKPSYKKFGKYSLGLLSIEPDPVTTAEDAKVTVVVFLSSLLR